MHRVPFSITLIVDLAQRGFMVRQPRPMIVLVVEDSWQRLECIRRCCPPGVRVLNPKDGATAITTIKRDGDGIYGAIMLDFDLHQQNLAALPLGRLKTGREVAQQVIRTIQPDIPILVHSMNPAGHAVMVQMLTDAGFDVRSTRFADLSAEKLTAWMSAARECWEDLRED